MIEDRPNPFGPEVQRYWDAREELFGRFDEGIVTDCEGLFSIKPERLALAIASRTPGQVVLDAFCGVGGSALAFARVGKAVVATDIVAERLEMARHNAKIYALDEQIEFKLLDAESATAEVEYDAVYLDPPWGGIDYRVIKSFRFESFCPNPLPIMNTALERKKNVLLTVPINFDFTEIIQLKLNFYVQWAFAQNRVLFATIFIEP